MGRSESAVPGGAGAVVRAKAVSGTQVVVLAWDVPDPGAREGLLGFAIRRAEAPGGQRHCWLRGGGKRFLAGTAAQPGAADSAGEAEAIELLQGDEAWGPSGQAWASEEEQPAVREVLIQGFSWCDLACRPGLRRCEYTICPVYRCCRSSPGGGSSPELRESAGARVVVELESNGADQPHEVWFNRGTAGGQAYTRSFGGAAPGDVPGDAAWVWLSRGLGEALLEFIGRAEGPGWVLYGAFYEFTWPPALVALREAADRGAEVCIVVDCGPTAPRAKKPPPAPGVSSGSRFDLFVPYAQKNEAKRLGARWDARKKVWFAPRGEADLVATWGAPPSTDGPLAADTAIDQIDGLRCLIKRRSNCKGISHNKFMVLTPPGGLPSVWTGSTNLTEPGIYGHSNVAHVINGNPDIAAEYIEYWRCLAADMDTVCLASRNAAQVGDNCLPLACGAAAAAPAPCEPAPLLAEEAAQVQAIMLPRQTLALLSHYARVLTSARHCACLTAAFGVNKALAEVLARDEAAVARYVLLEQPGPTYGQFAQVRANHVACGAFLGADERKHGFDEVAREGWAEERLTGLNDHVQFVHTKFMLVDPLGPAPVVVTGSANFSQASVQVNDENMLFIRGDTRVADLYFVEFWRLFKHWHFRDCVSKHSLERRSARGGGPPPLALSVADDDSWVAPFYTPGSRKCGEREMLMALHVPASSRGAPAPAVPAAPQAPQGCRATAVRAHSRWAQKVWRWLEDAPWI